MKRNEHQNRWGDNFRKNKERDVFRELKAGGFKCSHCRQYVVINRYIGTAHRNHCNICLWSKHVDEAKGDRRSNCKGGMEPIGLTFKHDGYGRLGEIMLIHCCSTCQKISINRIARDDQERVIFEVYNRSFLLDQLTMRRIGEAGIKILVANDLQELLLQLFGVCQGGSFRLKKNSGY